MPELRRDSITGRQVLVAAERGKRPGAFTSEVAPSNAKDTCPFCRGREAMTPPAVAIYPNGASEADWAVRVIPNKYPAVVPTEEDPADPIAGAPAGWFSIAPGFGAHEVVIEDPRHVSWTSDSTVENQYHALVAYRDRLLFWRNHDPRLRWGMALKNVGRAAGASIEHLHSQLIVLPDTPPVIARELRAAADYFERHSRCVYCDLFRQETDNQSRLVAEDDAFVAFCPFAARMPYETWIVARRHDSHFEQEPEGRLRGLASFLRRVLVAVESLPGLVGYNVVLQTAPFSDAPSTPSQLRRQAIQPRETVLPFDTPPLAYYHWRIEVVPRQVKLAGFELGSGLAINPIPPERAATILRAQRVSF